MQTDRTKPRGTLQALRRVSGRLRKIFTKQDSSTSDSPHLLVVDDEESIRFSLKEYFSHNGFIVDTAEDVEQAEKLILESEYKVVIQDLRMGADFGGLHIVKAVREHSPETRIIILTAYGSAEVEDEAKLLGADAFLRKPQPLSQVTQVVRGLIESPRRMAVRN